MIKNILGTINHIGLQQQCGLDCLQCRFFAIFKALCEDFVTYCLEFYPCFVLQEWTFLHTLVFVFLLSIVVFPDSIVILILWGFLCHEHFLWMECWPWEKRLCLLISNVNLLYPIGNIPMYILLPTLVFLSYTSLWSDFDK